MDVDAWRRRSLGTGEIKTSPSWSAPQSLKSETRSSNESLSSRFPHRKLCKEDDVCMNVWRYLGNCTPSKRNWKFLLFESSFPCNITIMLDSNLTSFIFLILLLVFKQSTISIRTYMQMFSFVFIIPRTLSAPCHQHFNTLVAICMRGIVAVYIVVPFTWLVGKMSRK